MTMPIVEYFADPSNGRRGLGASIRLDSGDRYIVNLSRYSVRVKARSALFGPVLYKEKDPYKIARTAAALIALFPDNLLPAGFTNPALIAFANAIMHCATGEEVSVLCNEAISRATERGLLSK
jgi:hypothetical protein